MNKGKFKNISGEQGKDFNKYSVFPMAYVRRNLLLKWGGGGVDGRGARGSKG